MPLGTEEAVNTSAADDNAELASEGAEVIASIAASLTETGT